MHGLNSWSRNIKWVLLTVVSVTFSNKLVLKDWNYRTHNTDMLNLDKIKFVYKKNYPWKKKFSGVLRSEICTIWEKWRAQEPRVDEVSAHKSRENHETIRRLTSQLQEMQDQMIFLNDSGEFQEVESNHSGRLSYVSSQPAMIRTSRSMLSRDKRLPLDTWNTSGWQENVFGYQFSTCGSPRDHHQGIQSDYAQRERGAVPQAAGAGSIFTRDDEQK